MNKEQELKLVEVACMAVRKAKQNIEVLSADLAMQVALKNQIGRTNMYHAKRSPEKIAEIIDELKIANDVFQLIRR